MKYGWEVREQNENHCVAVSFARGNSLWLAHLQTSVLINYGFIKVNIGSTARTGIHVNEIVTRKRTKHAFIPE